MRFSHSARRGLNLSLPRYTLPIAKHQHRLKALVDRFGRPGGNIQGFVALTAVLPGNQPGMAEHAQRQGQVVAGAGPGAKHRFFATSNFGQRAS